MVEKGAGLRELCIISQQGELIEVQLIQVQMLHFLEYLHEVDDALPLVLLSLLSIDLIAELNLGAPVHRFCNPLGYNTWLGCDLCRPCMVQRS
jgi:hypothetical protein